jgi:C1A family cysteine protease
MASDKGFGRIPAVDHRDRRHSAAARVTAESPVAPRRYYNFGPALDQGNTPQCVAYGHGQLIEGGPTHNEIFTRANAKQYLRQLYSDCQRNDEWEGENYDGTSVRAGMKVLRERGFIREYLWAWDVETITDWILRHGPVVMGTEWNDGMMGDSSFSARTGFIEPTGYFVGGHCYLLIGCNLDQRCPDGSRGAFRLLNSWGEEWMDGGRAWISFASVHQLLQRWPEAAMSKEIQVQHMSDRP